jgi:hypothetical protein
MVKEFLVLVAVYVGLSIFVEYVYLRCLAELEKIHFQLPQKRIVPKNCTKNTFVGRPELDFDLHVRNVDKLRFGDEK